MKDLKLNMSVDKVNELQEKVGTATENVEEAENLMHKLEKEILEWNPTKKLIRRDKEMDEILNLCHDFIEDLG